ncbi:hypothetical protein AB0L67_40865 [Streptomyces flaveolus]|uniref:DUF6174 domain-containing protein n=1 Tax=Streptomyces flaveolus TaxID=67297 RepID=UPI00342135C0
MEQARREGTHTVKAEYTADGHPERISLDWDKNPIDDETVYVGSTLPADQWLVGSDTPADSDTVATTGTKADPIRRFHRLQRTVSRAAPSDGKSTRQKDCWDTDSAWTTAVRITES